MHPRLPTLLVAIAWLGVAGCSSQPAGPPRNLVMISLDTLRADHLGLHGYARPTSPQLERFAQQAFVFENAVAAANYTIASHHALFQSQPANVALADREHGATLAAILKERGFHTAAFAGGGTLSQVTGFARGFDQWDESSADLEAALPKARAFLDAAAREQTPFYLFVHAFDVHLPYDPPPPYDALFADGYAGPVTGRNTMRLTGMHTIFDAPRGSSQPTYTPADRARIVSLYDAEIVRLDATLAGLFARLDAADLRDDTLVVVLSDHGEEFWDHGSVLHAHSLYQELLHVPLLLRVPGLERDARRIAQRVSLLDVVPTLLELLVVPAPAGLRGQSLVPLLHDTPLPPIPVFAESFTKNAKLQAVIDGDQKLIRNLDTGRLSLYDIAADPGEQHDLAQSRPEERERLLGLLDRGLAHSAAKSQDPLPLPTEVEPATEERLRELGYVE